MASCDKQVKCWDLGSNQMVQVAAHDAPVKTCHWVKAPTYTCLMTGSWDKTLKVLLFFILQSHYIVTSLFVNLFSNYFLNLS